MDAAVHLAASRQLRLARVRGWRRVGTVRASQPALRLRCDEVNFLAAVRTVEVLSASRSRPPARAVPGASGLSRPRRAPGQTAILVFERVRVGLEENALFAHERLPARARTSVAGSAASVRLRNARWGSVGGSSAFIVCRAATRARRPLEAYPGAGRDAGRVEGLRGCGASDEG